MAFDIKKTLQKLLNSPTDRLESLVDALPDDLAELIASRDFDKRILGGAGADVLFGSSGDDLILADPTVEDDKGGDDFVDGREGDDVILTFGGDDIVYGGPGDDVVRTADGDDLVDAGPGNDDVQSGRGRDTVFGGEGDDQLRGGEDDDFLDGGPGDDRVIGGSGNDTLVDGEGSDRLEGRAGNDTIILGPDGTTDRVVFTDEDVGTGTDMVYGFDSRPPAEGGDLLDLQGLGVADIVVSQRDGNTLVYVVPAEGAPAVYLARIEAVRVADLFDDNVLLPEGVTSPLDSPAVPAAPPVDMLVVSEAAAIA